MIAKKERFTRAEFTSFSAQPSLITIFNKLGTLKYTPEGHKLAVITTSKHEKRAVVRNKLRRRVYSWFRKQNTPLSGILYVSKQSYTLKVDETKELFENLTQKALTKR